MGLLPGLEAQLEFVMVELETGYVKLNGRVWGSIYKTQTTAGLADRSAAGAVPLAVADMFEDWIDEEIWRPCGSVVEEVDLNACFALLRKSDVMPVWVFQKPPAFLSL